MEVDELPTIDPHVDYSQILPIQQKRTVAFINHFIMNTVSFLNNFAQSCESRLMEFEHKIQKVEASLMILESQLSTISGLDDLQNNNVIEGNNIDTVNKVSTVDANDVSMDLPPVINNEDQSESNEVSAVAEEPSGVKYCEDPTYARFFKMVHFGVPIQAVKLKMETEGLDSTVLDSPNAIMENSSSHRKQSESSSDSSGA